MPDPQSPAMSLLTHLWQHTARRTTQRQRNDSMRQALRTAGQGKARP